MALNKWLIPIAGALTTMWQLATAPENHIGLGAGYSVQPDTIVNKPGAASMLPATEVAKAKADHHVLRFDSTDTTVLANRAGETKLGFSRE